MTLYGGAVMLLAYNARQVTKDVGAIVHPPDVARRLIARVTEERCLHAISRCGQSQAAFPGQENSDRPDRGRVSRRPSRISLPARGTAPASLDPRFQICAR